MSVCWIVFARGCGNELFYLDEYSREEKWFAKYVSFEEVLQKQTPLFAVEGTAFRSRGYQRFLLLRVLCSICKSLTSLFQIGTWEIEWQPRYIFFRTHNVMDDFFVFICLGCIVEALCIWIVWGLMRLNHIALLKICWGIKKC